MTYKKSASDDLLQTLLAAMVDEWGFERVRNRLEVVQSTDGKRAGVSEASVGQAQSNKHRQRSTEKPTAVAMAAKVSLPPKQKELIQKLAERFDDKRFLPTSGDIRYFFEVHGGVVPSSKQRGEAFRKVLSLLSALPEAELLKIVDSDAHSGPSKLGPLSDALRTAGELRVIGRADAPRFPQKTDEDAEPLGRTATKRPSDA